MIRQGTISILVLTMIASCSRDDPASNSIKYPDTVKVDHTDSYHGTEVADPYRWLEDDVRESDAVRLWVEKQNETTFAYLKTIEERDAIRARLEELWNYERFGLPTKKAGRYFYSYNDGLQNQSVIHMQARLEDEPRLLIDPNTWSEDGTVALASYHPSPDGRFFAYLVQDGGSDWRTAQVLSLDTGDVLADKVEWLKFTSLSWAADGSGFYYSRFPVTQDGEKFQSLNTNHAVYFHRIGDTQENDTLVYLRPENPEWLYFGSVTDDGAYLVITVAKGTDDRYQIIYQDLRKEGSAPVMLIEGFDFDYTLAGSIGSELYFRSNNAAPRGRLIAIDLDRPGEWREVIPQTDDVLSKASLVGGRIVAQYMQDAWSLVRIHDTHGKLLSSVDLPGIGSASGFDGMVDDPETFFQYESFDTPPTVNRFDVVTGEVELFKKSNVDFDSDDYVVEQVFYRSKDGTRVPMFIAHRNDIVQDGNRPTLLYGYGGFNISETPEFSITRLAWMEMGGVYAVANLRGGGEYGEAWHKAGTKLQKQNVFDDFIAAGEYLIAEKFTRPAKLAIFGGSNGGLLVGAVVNQRPELFGAAIPAVGVMDMLRFHQFTAGRFWVDDYGSSNDPEEFKALLAYSPYHNLQPGTEYPAVLVTTADTDDRVVPGHSFKYAAAIQAAQAGDAPVLIRVETRAGHGAGVPTAKIIEDYADRWAFLVENLDMKLPEGYGK
ncbi:MAG: prolyl oligopeptidase family serine peptidase [Gammaproteobacteria bacterium]|nr:prolyl oligopeptidase family serine peptidase [Gammaproteobacteria bacterium]